MLMHTQKTKCFSHLKLTHPKNKSQNLLLFNAYAYVKNQNTATINSRFTVQQRNLIIWWPYSLIWKGVSQFPFLQSSCIWKKYSSTKNNNRSTVIGRRNSACNCRKASLNGHHDHQYLDVTTTFTNFNSFITFSKQSLSYFEMANQIYDKNIAQEFRRRAVIT